MWTPKRSKQLLICRRQMRLTTVRSSEDNDERNESQATQQDHSIPRRASQNPRVDIEDGAQLGEEPAEVGMQVHEEALLADNLSQALGPHGVPVEARVSIRIDLLRGEEGGHIREGARGTGWGIGRALRLPFLWTRDGGMNLILLVRLYGILRKARAHRWRRDEASGGRARVDLGDGLTLERLLGHTDDLIGDVLKDLRDGDHGVAHHAGLAAAKRDECVGAATATSTRVGKAEDVGDGVAVDLVAEAHWTG